MNRILFALVLLASGVASAASYRVVDLNRATGLSGVTPIAVNAQGVVALRGSANGQLYSMLYDSNTGAVSRRYQANDWLEGVNNSNAAAGWAQGGRPAWIYDGMGRHELPGLPSSVYSAALGLNDLGDVAGYSNVGDSADSSAAMASLYLGDQGTTLGLGTLGGSSSIAWRVNAARQVTGWASTPADRADAEAKHAFLWQDGAMQDLGTLGGTDSFGLGINEGGQVAGFSMTSDGTEHAVLFDGATLNDLGTLPGFTFSRAGCINNNGDVAGLSSMGAFNSARATLWTSGGDVLDLNDLAPLDGGYVFQEIISINDAGLLLATASQPDRPGTTLFKGMLLIPQ